MKLLLIRDEPDYFGGAEKMLCPYAEALCDEGIEVAVAATEGSRLWEALSARVGKAAFREKRRFTPGKLIRELRLLRRFRQDFSFDVIHGWTDRDWEVASVLSVMTRMPAVGTLHNHPRATYVSSGRRRLMRGCARWGLRRVVCVSEAVRAECLTAGFPSSKLEVVHNGLPAVTKARLGLATRTERGVARIGFLGTFSAYKGLHRFFAIIDELARRFPAGWELMLAGEAQDEEGRELVRQLRAEFSGRAWWPRVSWLGWVKAPLEFLGTLDILVMPSTDFDSFPTILIEAGLAGVPVVASQVGGVPEIVVHGETGCLFPPEAIGAAAGFVAELLADPEKRLRLGDAARARIQREFTPARMASDYLQVYRSVLRG